ncbi:MAG: FliM/FliN family flagellar motor switch protein [Pyrinomonadaceae bacterium]
MASKKALTSGLNEPILVEEVSDPFAIDFFSQGKSVSEADEFDEAFVDSSLDEDTTAIIKRSWSADLPQIAISEINQTLVFSRLPDNLAKIVCEVSTNAVSQIILQDVTVANCQIISTVETDYSEEFIKLKYEQAVYLSFGVEPHQNEALLIIDAVFAVKIIETALSSEGVVGERRQLSKTELSVLEFLSLNCLKRINDFYSEPLFRWRTIEQGVPDLNLKRGLLSHIRLQIGENTGIIKLLLPFNFLQSLSQSENPLLARHKRGEKVVRISQTLPDIRLHAILGETIIDASELASLEQGDVILVERQSVKFTNSVLNGAVQIRVADEINSSLKGDLVTAESLRLTVLEANQLNENELMRSMMPENQLENFSTNHPKGELVEQTEETTEGGLALEKIVVNVSVELASRRISLAEMANLRVGQTIELGSRATDPVELVTGGRTVAIGELIDIEGNLGVRLTRVLL